MHPDFILPSSSGIKGRTSSITAAFVSSIVPVVEPTEQDVDEALSVLGMQRGACRCVYCGDTSTEWDHFHALVYDKRPTGYITEIANLVPACGKCNQSRGNKDWKSWMTGSARLSPATRGIADIPERIRRLEEYSRWREPKKIDFGKLVGDDDWAAYWADLARLSSLMEDCEQHARRIRQKIRESLG